LCAIFKTPAAGLPFMRQLFHTLMAKKPSPKIQENIMNLSLSIGPIVSLIAGVLILLIPRLLNYIVAVYLIVIGLIGLFGTGSLRI
jgi:hypothetical protein